MFLATPFLLRKYCNNSLFAIHLHTILNKLYRNYLHANIYNISEYNIYNIVYTEKRDVPTSNVRIYSIYIANIILVYYAHTSTTKIKALKSATSSLSIIIIYNI